MESRSPLFAHKLHVGCPNIGDRARLIARIHEILDRRWLTNDGPCVRAFEKEIVDWLGVRHCVAVCNATAGLEIAISALRLTGEVIVPAFTFPATIHALVRQGVMPVFCDVDPQAHTIDPAAAERLVSSRTTGILGVHLWGNGCDVRSLEDLAERHGLKVLFDAAHALGCSHQGQMIGHFGDAEVFSFHATKFVNSGEGGAIVTNDDALARSLRRLRNFGLEGTDVEVVGTNAKMSELSGAMGLTSLESRDEIISRNRDNHEAYAETLADLPGVQLICPREGEQHNYQYVVVAINEDVAGTSRDELLAALHAENVVAKRYFYPGCHRMTPYDSQATQPRVPMPHTERLCAQLLQLPTGQAVSRTDIARIGGLLKHLTRVHRKAA